MLKVNLERYAKGDKTLLRDVEFELPASSFHVILGPNGAGKSTLLSLLSGLVSAGQGKVWLNDQPLNQYTSVQRAQSLVVLTQDNPLDFAFSVADVVAMGVYPLGLNPEDSQLKVNEALAHCDLTELANRSYLTLSGGEQQRVHLARSLAQLGDQTQLLLLDEPLKAMDLGHQHDTLRELARLAKTGLCVVAVLHDPELAARYADGLIYLKDASLVEYGSVERLWQSELLADLYSLELEASVEGGVPRLHIL